MNNFSNNIDQAIQQTIKKYPSAFDNNVDFLSEFQKLLSMGELIDRLSIVNFKLYDLKNKVAQSNDTEFKSQAADEDIKLVLERARLKKCIDAKLKCIIQDLIQNPKDLKNNTFDEIKHYG